MTTFEELIMIPVKSRKFIEPFHRNNRSFLPLHRPQCPPERNRIGICLASKQDQTPSAVVGGSECNSDDALVPGIHFDSMRVDWENDDESDIESEVDPDAFDHEEFGINLLEMAEKIIAFS